MTVVAKAVVSECERSVAIDQAQGSVINTGEIQSVNIINVSLSPGSQESTLTTSDIGSAVNLVKLTQSLSTELSKRIAAELENAREMFREGKTQQSFQDVRGLLTSPNWQALDDSLRAMILRALANMVLSLKGKDGIDEAQAYIDDASHFDSATMDRTARVRIKLLRDGFAAGLAELGNATTLDAFNLRVGILIETDQTDEALKELASPPAGIALDAESERLRAIALLLNCDLEGARGAISEALKKMPRRQNVRLAAAVIDYYSSLSPLALQRQVVAYPHPVNPAIVKRDNESQGRLRSAAQQFAEVAAQMEPGSNSQKEVETWQIACLANISDGMGEAVDLCKSALLRDPMNFRVLAWVLYRGYEIDLAESEDALKKLLGGPVNEDYRIHYVLALLGIYLKKEATESVLKLLDAEKALFENSGHADLWLYWRGQTLVIGGQLVLGDLPIYEDLREKFWTAIKSIEIDEVFVASPGIAHAALTTAANQIRHWGDEELRALIRAKILAAITFEIERDTLPMPGTSATDGDTRERRIVDLVDAALKLSIVHGDLSTTGRNLADILESISELWPDFTKRFNAMISAFLWELPVDVVVSWWPLCLKLRATMSESW